MWTHQTGPSIQSRKLFDSLHTKLTYDILLADYRLWRLFSCKQSSQLRRTYYYSFLLNLPTHRPYITILISQEDSLKTTSSPDQGTSNMQRISRETRFAFTQMDYTLHSLLHFLWHDRYITFRNSIVIVLGNTLFPPTFSGF